MKIDLSLLHRADQFLSWDKALPIWQTAFKIALYCTVVIPCVALLIKGAAFVASRFSKQPDEQELEMDELEEEQPEEEQTQRYTAEQFLAQLEEVGKAYDAGTLQIEAEDVHGVEQGDWRLSYFDPKQGDALLKALGGLLYGRERALALTGYEEIASRLGEPVARGLRDALVATIAQKCLTRGTKTPILPVALVDPSDRTRCATAAQCRQSCG